MMKKPLHMPCKAVKCSVANEVVDTEWQHKGNNVWEIRRPPGMMKKNTCKVEAMTL